MASEAKRGVIRLAANYTRVFTVVVLGLVIVRLLLKGAGNDGWALIAMLGATAGMGTMVQESVRTSLIRELGAAYHSGNDDRFRSAYNAALAISVAFLSIYTRRVTVEGYAMGQALTAAQIELSREQKLAAIGGIAAAAAHELGTPLATIKLAAGEC